MSNFNIFKDPTAPGGPPATNPHPNPPLNTPLNTPHSTHYCTHCLHEKSSPEFSPDEFLLATPTPLRDATNEQNSGPKNKRRKNNGLICIACREKVNETVKGGELRLIRQNNWKEFLERSYPHD